MRKGICYILLFLSTALFTKAQDISISASFDSTRIYIGDQIHFTVNVEQPSDIRLDIPSFKDTLVKNIEIINGPDVDSITTTGGRLKITEKYLITSFDSGFYQIDPMYVEVKNPDGVKRFFSDYARLEVMKYKVAPVDSSARIYDIIEPYKAPITVREMIPWVLVGLAAVALAWAAIILFRKYKSQKTGVQEIINPDPAHVIAFRELEKLKSEELWQKGQYKLYYTRLTEILRQYLENRYRVFSLELTTKETLDALLATGFRNDIAYSRLRTVLTAADLVKFAKYVPAGDENETHFINSWEFVEATKEIIVPQEVKPEGNKEKEAGV